MQTKILIILISALFYANVAISAAPETSTNTIVWKEYSNSIYDTAKEKQQLILVYGQASWCEWCKKFSETTLKDPAVIALVNNNFIPAALDIDTNKAAAINFAIIELPTILIVDSNRRVIKSTHGYLTAEAMKSFMELAIKENPAAAITTNAASAKSESSSPILPDATRRLLIDKQWLFYGELESEGGGESYSHDPNTKYVSRFSMQYALGLVQAGNHIALKWINNTLENGMLLIDPVWGGMYAGSSNGDWVHPNYEKKLSVQTVTIPLYLDAYAITGKREYYTIAESMIYYMRDFLMSPEGVFYHSQESKMKAGAQDAAYYKLNDSLRRANGIPEINKEIFTDENGSAINALVQMYMTSGNKTYLDQAIKAADWIVNNLGTADGGFRHTREMNSGIYLADNVYMSQAFLNLYAASTEPQYLMRAKRALDYIDIHFQNKSDLPGFVSFVAENVGTKEDQDTIAIDNTVLARIASLVYNYTHEEKYLHMAERSLSYLISPDVITENIPALALIANAAVTTHPLNITVIGEKDDPAALELYFAALKFPSFFMTYHWYASAAESAKESEIQFPSLPKAAAFFCAGGRCSLPLYTAEEFETISKKLTQQQSSDAPANIISNITTIFPKYSLMRAQQIFSDIMITRNWPFIVITFWAIGLLLAFTPCVFPLLLVLSTLLMSSSGMVSRSKMFALTMTYILSLAITYALLGYAAGALGSYLQLYLQSPVILIGMSLLLTILAFSLLGGYKIKLPPSIQHYFISFNSFRASNTFLGAALMGVILTLVASPCAAAPLIGVLSIISQIGDPMLGVIALFMMGIGMGTPLLFVWLIQEHVMPRVQAWQHELETVFGLVILSVAIWMASRVIPNSIYLMLVAGLAIVTALYMGVARVTAEGSLWNFWKALSIMILIYGIGLMTGALIGNDNPFTPLSYNQTIAQPYRPASIGIFQTVKSEAELINLLRISQKQKRPLLLDFYASWCASCVTIDRDVFTNPKISDLMLNFTLVRIDLSDRDSGSMAIAKKFDVVAPPAIIFFDSNGYELNTRLYGDMKVDEFAQTLKDVLKRE